MSVCVCSVVCAVGGNMLLVYNRIFSIKACNVTCGLQHIATHTGQEAFTTAIQLWEKGLGQVGSDGQQVQVNPQLASQLRQVLRHAYTVQDVYEHIR